MSKVLGIGIAGLGTVGTGFLKQLKGLKTNSLKSANIRVVKIAVKSLKKKRDLPIKQLPLTSNTLSLAEDDSIDVVVELIGGSKGIAYNLVKRSLKNKIGYTSFTKNHIFLVWEKELDFESRLGKNLLAHQMPDMIIE